MSIYLTQWLTFSRVEWHVFSVGIRISRHEFAVDFRVLVLNTRLPNFAILITKLVTNNTSGVIVTVAISKLLPQFRRLLRVSPEINSPLLCLCLLCLGITQWEMGGLIEDKYDSVTVKAIWWVELPGYWLNILNFIGNIMPTNYLISWAGQMLRSTVWVPREHRLRQIGHKHVRNLYVKWMNWNGL